VAKEAAYRIDTDSWNTNIEVNPEIMKCTDINRILPPVA